MNQRVNSNESSPCVKIIPLGGLHEIGKNTCVFEYEDEILLLDAGLAFPTEGMHGVNVVLPDITYLLENRHKIKGLIVTHGHEDHIGGIAFHLRQLDIPVIYGPRLAMALLEGKLEEAGVSDRTEIRTVRARDTVRVGNSFLVEYIRNTHSISDSFSIAIHTPAGVIIHTGDFKVDHTPVDGEYFDFQKLAEYGSKGVLCLLSDSTNAEVPGTTPSERSVFPNLDRAFSQAEGRLLVTTFASSVHRVNMLLELAQTHNRSVAVVGRSMLNVIAHARNLGYVTCPDNLFVPLKQANSLAPENVMILTTGSQGEPMAAMTRIANQSHRQVKIKEGDTVIFSSNPIPGNTIAVMHTIDKLMMQGAKVIHGRQAGLHVSGHGAQEDQKLMIAMTRPKFFMPVHGEHRMLVKHAETAQAMGIPAENIVVADNGDVMELTADSFVKADKISSGIELMDSSRTGVVEERTLRDRQHLAEDGLVTISASIGWNGTLMLPPAVHLRGVVSTVDQSRIEKWITDTIERGAESKWSEYSQAGTNGKVEVDWDRLQHQLENDLRRLLRRELKSNPLLMLLIQKPVEPNVPASAELTPSKRRSSRGPSSRRNASSVVAS
ncbi:MAG: ribonuclease J [Cyanobacteria bacterium P01_F01_bin.150]